MLMVNKHYFNFFNLRMYVPNLFESNPLFFVFNLGGFIIDVYKILTVNILNKNQHINLIENYLSTVQKSIIFLFWNRNCNYS